MSQHTTPATVTAPSELPLVSIVIPCRSEREFIGRCLASIVASDYPHDRLEVLVVDGMSEDGTREEIAAWSARHPFIRRLDNPDRTTPFAMNAGVRNARGSLLMIMSAHATYAPDAIRLSVEHSIRSGAENVGGSWRIVPRDSGLVARAIALGLSHKFGVGGATYRTGGAHEPMWVDTAAYGCYRREVFDRIGLFNEQLVRSQDFELNLRLRRSGGRTLLVPNIVITYFARTTYQTFLRHNWRNGVWIVVPSLYSEVMMISPRHLVPLVFVLGVLAPAALMLEWPAMGWVSLAALAAYLLATVAASIDTARKELDWRLLFAMPAIFAGIHIPYGLGSLWALLVEVPARFLGGRKAR